MTVRRSRRRGSLLALPDVTLAIMGDRFAGIEEARATGMRWSATGLPAGMWCDEPTGLILGAPERAGTYSVTVTGTEVLRWPWSWLRACERVRWLRWAGRWSR